MKELLPYALVLLSPILVTTLALLIRKAIKSGYLGFQNQLRLLVKDKKTREEILEIVDNINDDIIHSKETEKIVKEVVKVLKKRIPGKLDDIILEAVVRAVYEEEGAK